MNMWDLITNIALLLLVAYLLNKWFFGFGSEYVFKKAVKELQEKLEKIQGRVEGRHFKFEEEELKETKEDLEKLAETYDAFNHLKEKYRHSFNIRRKILNDWFNYNLISLRMRGYDRAFFADLDDKQITKIHEQKYKDKIKAEEIEKRFKNLQA